MDQSRKQMLGVNPSDVINVQLSDKELLALIELLNFSKEASTMLTKKELESESPNKLSIETLLKIARHSRHFVEILATTANIGNPVSDEIN